MSSESENCAICNNLMSIEKVFTCFRCEKKCHQTCFLYKEEEMKALNINKCDQCRALDNAGPDDDKINKLKSLFKCVICLKKDGMLNVFKDHTNGVKWTHIKCIQWFMKKMTLKFDNNFLIFKSAKALPDSIYMATCKTCSKTKKGDYLVECQSEGCEKAFHTECIDNNLLGEIKSDERLKSITFYCEEHMKCKKINDPFPFTKINKNITFNYTHEQSKIMTVQIPDIKFEKSDDVILNSFKTSINLQSSIDDKSNNNNNKLKLDLKKQKNKKNNKNMSLNSHHENFINNNENINDTDMCVNTTFKCDICLKSYENETKEILKRCDNCITFYHPSCAKEFGDKELKNLCKKCSIDPDKEISCMACDLNTGSMIKCESRWIHILCAIFHKKFFYKKQDHTHHLGMEVKQNKIEKVCHLCKKSNCFTLKCNNCEFVYHPYCAFKWNFDIVRIENKRSRDFLSKFDFVCACENHNFYFNKNDRNERIDRNDRNDRNEKKKKKSLLENKEVLNKESPHSHSHNNNNNNILPGISKKNDKNKKIKNGYFKERRIKKIKVEKILKISSFNYQHLKNNIINKFKSDPYILSKLKEWNWEMTDNYFLPITENDLESMKINPQEINLEETTRNDLLLNLENEDKHSREKFKFKENVVICNIKTKLREKFAEYICLYDTSKISDMKLNPDFVNYQNELNNQPLPNKYKFISKRKRSPDEDKNIKHMNFIMNRNIKIIEDDENSNSNDTVTNSNLTNTGLTKFKFSFDEIVENQTDRNSNNIPIIPSLKANSLNEVENTFEITSDKKNPSYPSYPSNQSLERSKEKKFLKKIKLMSYFKLKKKDRMVLHLEDTSTKKTRKMLAKKEISFENINDIDKEILIKNEMLKTTFSKNLKNLNKINKSIIKKISDEKNDGYYDILSDKNKINNLLTTSRSIYKYKNIMIRLCKGVEEKSIEDMINNRGPSYKFNHKNENELDKDYFENLIRNDTECCVCFYTDADDSIPIVFCDSCNVSVHQECYGIAVIPEGDYFCDVCAFNNNNKTKKNIQECVLCTRSGGAMKQVSESQQWAHVACILVSQSLRIKDYSKFDFVQESYNTSLQNKNKCEICKKESGELFESCSEDYTDTDKSNNNVFYHFLCSYLEGHKIKIKTEHKSGEKYYKQMTPMIYNNKYDFQKKQNDYQLKQKNLRNLIYHKENLDFKNKFKKDAENYQEHILKSYRLIINNKMDIDSNCNENFSYVNKCAICFTTTIDESTTVGRCSRCYQTNKENICDTCDYFLTNKLSTNSNYCLLCMGKGGAMRQCNSTTFDELEISSAKWVHTACAKYIKEINLDENNIYQGFDLIIPKKLNLFKCEICEMKVGCVFKCKVEDCINKFHIHCAFTQDLNRETSLDNEYLFYCKLHSRAIFNKSKKGPTRKKIQNIITSLNNEPMSYESEYLINIDIGASEEDYSILGVQN